ncbi:hypothetical protein DRP04_06275 [Archaeoglobales archaeon]|nr:MAG: hypothetical protein DRP04_06275 [Archaeoglobales archaeon]
MLAKLFEFVISFLSIFFQFFCMMLCPRCKGKLVQLGTGKGIRLYECKGCGAIYEQLFCRLAKKPLELIPAPPWMCKHRHECTFGRAILEQKRINGQ